MEQNKPNELTNKSSRNKPIMKPPLLPQKSPSASLGDEGPGRDAESSAPDVSLWNLSKETLADLSEQLHWPRPSKRRSSTRQELYAPQPQALLVVTLCPCDTGGVADASPEGPSRALAPLTRSRRRADRGRRSPKLTPSLESRLWQNPRESHSWVGQWSSQRNSDCSLVTGH